MDLDAESTLLPEPTRADATGLREGSAPAWESFYAELRKFVARQMGGQQEADDVVQDIYREVLRSRSSEVTNPRAWIFKIAWRVVHEAFHRENRHRQHHQTADPQAIESLRIASSGTAAPIDLQLEARDELLHALEGLPLATQIAIVRSRADGWTYEEIAVELGVTTHMVKKHIVRAIAHFDAFLEQVDARSAQQEVKP